MRVNGDDAESQLSDEILQLTKDMMELQQNGKLTNEFIKRLNELKHADHAEFIDANSLAKLRHLTIDVSVNRYTFTTLVIISTNCHLLKMIFKFNRTLGTD